MPAREVFRSGGKEFVVRLLYESSDADEVWIARLYEAWDGVLGRTVAVKEIEMLRDDAAAQRVFAHARDEARLIARLRHPNLPMIYDVIEETKRVCILMEYVDGETVARRFQLAEDLDREMPDQSGVAAILQIGLDVCRALQALHREGVAHRDISPANIIVGRKKTTLIDFGLSVLPARYAYRSQGEGTLGYRAPEQTAARAPFALPGPPSDIYGLGAVLYHLLTGAPPPPPLPGRMLKPPGEINPAVPRGLDPTLTAALAYEAKLRPGIGQLHAQLRGALRALQRDPAHAPADSIAKAPAAMPTAALSAESSATHTDGGDTDAGAGDEQSHLPSKAPSPAPLIACYNEGTPMPPTLPAPPPVLQDLPVLGSQALPSSEEQQQAQTRVVIAAAVLMVGLLYLYFRVFSW